MAETLERITNTAQTILYTEQVEHDVEWDNKDGRRLRCS